MTNYVKYGKMLVIGKFPYQNILFFGGATMKKTKMILRVVGLLVFASLFVCLIIIKFDVLTNDTTSEDFKILHEKTSDVVDESGVFHIENIPNDVNTELKIDEKGNSITFTKGTAKVSYVFSPLDGHATDLFEISTRKPSTT